MAEFRKYNDGGRLLFSAEQMEQEADRYRIKASRERRKAMELDEGDKKKYILMTADWYEAEACSLEEAAKMNRRFEEQRLAMYD